MNLLFRNSFLSFRPLIVFLFFVPALMSWGADKGEKLKELKQRSERILASLNQLDAKLNGLRQGEDAPVPQSTIGDSLDEEVIWEDADSIPLPEDPEDTWLPKSEETPAAPGTETIEWDAQADDEKEQEQEEEIFREDEDFDFVIEKFEEDESFESGDDPFDGASNDYRFSSNDYYVIFNYGIQLGSEIEFESSFNNYKGDLDVSFGNNLSVEFGKSFETFELGLLVGFNNADIDGLSGVINGSGSGEISNYYFAIRPNYIHEFSDAMALRAGTSLGFSSRHNHFDSDHVPTMYFFPTLPNYTFQEEKLCFLLDFHTTLQWALWESGGILFGYRFAYVTGTGDFGGQVANSFEFGGRWGF